MQTSCKEGRGCGITRHRPQNCGLRSWRAIIGRLLVGWPDLSVDVNGGNRDKLLTQPDVGLTPKR
jgi:hypothetical protein